MFKRRFLRPIVWRNFSATAGPSVTASTTIKSMPPINIPTRIKRKPTDILKALASTVKEDPTGQKYMFIDDPLFTPTKTFEAQNFALSKELGRKAARYFAAQYPTLFMYDEDEPRLNAFRPIQKPTSEKADDEESLNDRIDRLWVRSAMTVYENASSRQKSISTSSKLKLLELLAFYNNDDPTDLPETSTEIWYRQYLTPAPKATWAENGLAMQIYDSLPEPKDPRATAAIICGMLKHFAVEKGYELWQLSRQLGGDQGKLKDARIYESLIKYGVERLKAVNSERWDMILDIFKSMAEDGVQPTLQVFNAAFHVLAKASRWRRTEETARQLIQEMSQLGIQPSLATYYYILRIHNKRLNLGGILNEMLTRLENRTTKNESAFEFVDETDGKFFVESMLLSCEQLHDRSMALRVHRLLKTGDNYLYMTDESDEKKYYRALLTFLSVTEDTKWFYERYYQRITPRYFVPDVRLLEAFMQNIEMSGSYQYLPQVCSELISYGHIYRRDLLFEFLSAALRAPVYQMTTVQLEDLAAMAKTIYEKIESQYEAVEQQKLLDRKAGLMNNNSEQKNEDELDKEIDGGGETKTKSSSSSSESRHKSRDVIRLEWTSDLLASLAVLCARGGSFNKAWEIYSRVVPLTEEELLKSKRRNLQQTEKDRSTIIGEVPQKLAVEMLDHFVKQKSFDRSYAALRVIVRGKNVDVIKESADKIKKNISTNVVQLSKLESISNADYSPKKDN